jgi:pilus assembly protein TadC
MKNDKIPSGRRSSKTPNAWSKIVLISELGFSLVSPVLLCLFLSLWIREKSGAGYGIVIFGILLGIACMGANFWRFYKRELKNSTKNKRNRNQFNDYK